MIEPNPDNRDAILFAAESQIASAIQLLLPLLGEHAAVMAAQQMAQEQARFLAIVTPTHAPRTH